MEAGSSKRAQNKDPNTIKKRMKDDIVRLQSKFSKLSQKFESAEENDKDGKGGSSSSSSSSSSFAQSSVQHPTPIASTSKTTNTSATMHANNDNNKIKQEAGKIEQKLPEAKSQCCTEKNNEPNTSVKKDSKSNSRSRSTSGQASIVYESSEIRKGRSQSITMSVASVASNNIFEDKRSKRKRRRQRKGQNVKGQRFEELYEINANEFRLNAETFLILDMLSTVPEERDEFLIKVAKAKKVLVIDPETNHFEINPEILKLRKVFRQDVVLWDSDDAYGSVLSMANNQHKRADDVTKQSIKKERSKVLFEDLVNAVVGEGLSEEEKKRFTFPRLPRKDRMKNYFHHEEFIKRLEAFAQKCVEAKLGVIIEGEVRVNAKNNDQAFIKHVEGEKDAMFSSQLIRKCALHGDIVRAFIRIIPHENKENSMDISAEVLTSMLQDEDDEEPEIVPERSAKGFAIKIVQEIHNRKCIGSFLSYRLDSEYITFVPRDMKMPNIRIYKPNWPKSFTEGNMDNISDVLYEAIITEWNGETVIGKILQPVGKCGQLESENKAILLQNNLNMDPYADKFNEMFYGPLFISKEEIAKREDIRRECIFTIDPLTARDLDDALSCKRLPDGNFEIGVHISDVTHFLAEESELDEIVKTRTTSVYLVNEVYHMLPKPLCFKCSLLPGEDKFAFSVFWIMTPEGEVLNTRFSRTIVNSCTQFAYEHAQKIIDYPEKDFTENDFPLIYNGFTPSDIVSKIKQLHSIAAILRNKRFDGGSLKINRPKLYFDLDSVTGEPVNYGIAELNTANYLIEEFMLLANQSVAKYIYEKYPDISILRHHEPPLSNVIKNLKDRLKCLGYELDITSSKSLYESFQRLVRNSKHPDVMEICLSHLISKPMTRAKYFCSSFKKDFWHYALAVPIYTHFTSPIRRYPDILVHRVLSAALEYTPKPKRTPEELKTLANVCNEKKYNAKLAGEDSANLYFLHYIKSKQHVAFRAAILDLAQHSLEAILVETGHILRIRYPNKEKTGVKVVASGKRPNITVQLIFKDPPDENHIELKIFSEILVEVFVEKNKLKGRIAIPSKNKDAEDIENSDNNGEESSDHEGNISDDEAEKQEVGNKKKANDGRKLDSSGGGKVKAVKFIPNFIASLEIVYRNSIAYDDDLMESDSPNVSAQNSVDNVPTEEEVLADGKNSASNSSLNKPQSNPTTANPTKNSKDVCTALAEVNERRKAALMESPNIAYYYHACRIPFFEISKLTRKNLLVNKKQQKHPRIGLGIKAENASASIVRRIDDFKFGHSTQTKNYADERYKALFMENPNIAYYYHAFKTSFFEVSRLTEGATFNKERQQDSCKPVLQPSEENIFNTNQNECSSPGERQQESSQFMLEVIRGDINFASSSSENVSATEQEENHTLVLGITAADMNSPHSYNENPSTNKQQQELAAQSMNLIKNHDGNLLSNEETQENPKFGESISFVSVNSEQSGNHKLTLRSDANSRDKEDFNDSDSTIEWKTPPSSPLTHSDVSE